MPYATKQDMTDRFSDSELIQITDRDNLGAFNEAVFVQAQKDGDADIDVRIQARYPLPLAHVPTVLVRIACDLYRYYLYGNIVPDHVKDRYNAAIKLLDQVNAGAVSLNPDADAVPPAATGFAKGKAPDRIFTDDTLKGY